MTQSVQHSHEMRGLARPEAGLVAGAPSTAAHNEACNALIDSMSVAGIENTYFVGPFTKRVSFVSQQNRALNLVWALEHRGIISKAARVAVVGGGLAGVTAAAALVRRRVKVTFFEQNGTLFPLQRQTAIRFIHPTINFWPYMNLNPTTELPLLVWSEGICESVIHQIEAQWDAEFSEEIIELRQPCKVLPFVKGPASVCFIHGGVERTTSFDAVIVAMGFGLETALMGTVAPSYWDNYDLVQVGRSPGSFLISGAGDGGLLETLRVAFHKNFRLGRLTVEVAHKLDKSPLREDILKAEEKSRNLGVYNQQCNTLKEHYTSFDVPKKLREEIRSFLNPPGSVRLVARNDHAFTPNSAPIHRFLLGQAVLGGAVEIEEGELGLGENDEL